MTAILVSGVTSQNKIIFHRFYIVIDESKLDEMFDFSSKTEVCIWAKYSFCIVKETLGNLVPFTADFSGGKVSTSREFLRPFKHIDFTFNG